MPQQRATNSDVASLNEPLPQVVRSLEDEGRLADAAAQVGRLLDARAKEQSEGREDPDDESDDRSSECSDARLRLELERLRRVPLYYNVTREDAVRQIREEVPGFTEAQLDLLIQRGSIDARQVEGQQLLLRSWLQGLRRMPDEVEGLAPVTNYVRPDLLAVMDEMRECGHAARRLTVREHVSALEPAQKDQLVQAWLPLPRKTPEQTGIEVLSTTTEGVHVPPVESKQRTAYWEVRGSSSFELAYRYTIDVPYVDAYAAASDEAPAQSHGKDATGAEAAAQEAQRAVLQRYLRQEEPHLVSTPRLRQLADELAEGAQTPLQRARAAYDYVTRHVTYRYMPAYLLLDSIADECARTLHGDCGVMALLFIELCRLMGVPARWQSGLLVRPDSACPHDWAQFWAQPYGWLWADCSFGASAHVRADEDARRFYFGNIDPWRMIANSEFMAPLSPSAEALRDDPFDNQQGEMAIDGVGLSDEQMVRQRSVVCMGLA
ncbi:MAG: transglutaminase family protein [Atopobiaceae bacterium]